MNTDPKSDREKWLDAMADEALASCRPAGTPEYPTPDRENSPMAWDLTRFWIWMDPEAGDGPEAAVRALEYTGE